MEVNEEYKESFDYQVIKGLRGLFYISICNTILIIVTYLLVRISY